MFYFKVSDPDAFSAAKFPVFLSLHPPVFSTHSVYGTPILEYPGLLKVCLHGYHLELSSTRFNYSVKTPFQNFILQFLLVNFKKRFVCIEKNMTLLCMIVALCMFCSMH